MNSECGIFTIANITCFNCPFSQSHIIGFFYIVFCGLIIHSWWLSNVFEYFRHSGRVCHMRIFITEDNKYYLHEDALFQSMGHFLLHYKTCRMPSSARILKGFRLLFPVTQLDNGRAGYTFSIRCRPNKNDESPLIVLKPGVQGATSRFVGEKQEEKRTELLPAEDLRTRAPEPLPVTIEILPTDSSLCYYTIADEESNQSPWLRNLLQFKAEMRKRCSCGLLVTHSKLPGGWQVHRSDDPQTEGYIFFVNPKNRLYRDLPDSIYKQLNKKQCKFLGELFGTDKSRVRGPDVELIRKTCRYDTESSRHCVVEATPANVPYTYAAPHSLKEEEINRLPQLRKALQVTEEQRKRCICGLLMVDTKLPGGWEVHRSDEAPTKGRVFFVSPDHQSHWDLPEYIKRQLDERQHKYLSELLASDPKRCQRSNVRCKSGTS